MLLPEKRIKMMNEFKQDMLDIFTGINRTYDLSDENIYLILEFAGLCGKYFFWVYF